jgi:hypothetical protein
MATIKFKRGDTFDQVLIFPEETFPDGYFLGWTVTSEVRTATGRLVGELTPTWVAPEANTRSLRLVEMDTTTWPIGTHELDVQFVSPTGFVRSTETLLVDVLRDVTQ